MAQQSSIEWTDLTWNPVVGCSIESAGCTNCYAMRMAARLDGVIADASRAFDAYDYTGALERIESFFWWFCDDYVELVKSRAYGTHGEAGATSALAALRLALGALHRLFAPFVPFVTDEVWSWWQKGSVHAQNWPTVAGTWGDDGLLEPVSDVLVALRKAKTEAKASQKADIALLTVRAQAHMNAVIASAERDLCDAGSVAELRYETADELTCEIVLAQVTLK